MKRILFIAQHLNRAGTEAFMMGVFRGIDHSRFQVDFLIYTQAETDYSREVEAAGCKVWRVPSRRESPLGWYRSLNSFFKLHTKDYAAIHYCGNGLTAIAPIMFAYHYGVPVRIIHSHNSSSKGLHNKLLHLLQRGIARRISTHHFACSTLAAKWFFSSHPAVIIKNGIDTNRFAFNDEIRQTYRNQLGISPATTVIGHVGRFCDEKNHTFLVDIFNAYSQLNPNSLLLLIGVGPLMDDIKAKVLQLGLSDKVQFLNERSDVDSLLQAFDLFLMPSLFEGLPFVLIEAQCTGLPCLVADTVSRDSALTSNITFFSLKQTAGSWAEKVSGIIANYNRKDESMAIQQQGYSTQSTISYLQEVYDGQS
ncbi:glycosyltransferase family 1 protein [Prevotella sp. E9-3]|uniref:glycosyltransferase family 1 protein n=1 Tax=Prevotella sp. E9-3 TaxID=2913621 RepID=UPI001EDAADAE|nr:glycosyltransferase family 1 protein [Prevotella sp. E9-3]UKK49258.1 glycosyltransferase family 1 protein [Prevotella sp. E9-3]